MRKIKKYILPTLLYGAVIYSLFFIYQTQIKVLTQEVSARGIDPSCDIIMFTTEHCPYCKKAKTYLASHGVAWCERDIEWSDEAALLFKQLGGVGTPLTIIGDEIIGGFNNEIRFASALNKLQEVSQ
jgi:glutaredoxin